ncbi:MAG: type III-A CRISPR-associated protein Cas10/Csm1 [Candidatus Omnitrophica bacterium 4484_70.1]|nr:MAG: type III-A CRISPR-associated protein Cas10/Csm1 [Candidatus Omnitrophica bacterium 4484_70.1]
MKEPQDLKRQAIILASLLHDIGKFSQRAGEKLTEKERRDAEYFCPKNEKGLPTHLHVIFSERFIKTHFKMWDKAATLALKHHKPDVYEEKIVQLADWLSCGERRDRKIEEEIEIKREPLISIFSQIALKGRKDVDVWYCPVRKNSGKIEELFPVDRKEKAINEIDSFENLYKEFEKEVKCLEEILDFEELICKILFLLEKYTLFIPSSAYKDRPEISLYHHLKTTAAIATCLYDLKLEEQKLDRIISEFRLKEEKYLEDEDFLLLSGDISGIQDFIYSVTTERALKGLRARSFYLQLLSETIARRILDEFDLTLCNLIYCGGGNFSLLLPNINKAEEKIETLIKDIEENIFKAHQGKLSLIMSYVKLSYEDFDLSRFVSVIEKLRNNLAKEKKRKFKYILDYSLFSPQDVKKESKGCEICGRETDEKDLCDLCESFVGLSGIMKEKEIKYLELEKIENLRKELTGEVRHWSELFESIGYKWWFKGKGKQPNFNNFIYLLNSSDFLKENTWGFRFEATYTPYKEDSNTKTLEDIADDAKGIKKWGALRMDVDNLGKIFSEGLIYNTISRFSMLSYMVSLFFSAGVREIVEKKCKNCCVVYSGGDDLFILGPWSDLPELAEDIYENFREYVCYHPKITISGGIYIAPSKKFPVYHAAREAESEEKKAKREGKDRISFMGKELTWQDFKEVKNVCNLIKDILDKGVARSLLTVLYAGCEEERLNKEGKVSILRIWRLFYQIKRFMERYETSAPALEDLRKKN